MLYLIPDILLQFIFNLFKEFTKITEFNLGSHLSVFGIFFDVFDNLVSCTWRAANRLFRKICTPSQTFYNQFFLLFFCELINRCYCGFLIENVVDCDEKVLLRIKANGFISIKLGVPVRTIRDSSDSICPMD